jgi:hypothetical protein
MSFFNRIHNTTPACLNILLFLLPFSTVFYTAHLIFWLCFHHELLYGYCALFLLFAICPAPHRFFLQNPLTQFRNIHFFHHFTTPNRLYSFIIPFYPIFCPRQSLSKKYNEGCHLFGKSDILFRFVIHDKKHYAAISRFRKINHVSALNITK